ncbi:MAG: TonB family protein, partial [Candidatus Eremiobacteraeota bacterium]|nr:TonB family protein [Candidatus Eremiobacteraeota bacterium]
MNGFLKASLVIAAVAYALPAAAATSNAVKFNYYFPPKLVKRASPTVAVGGSGRVIVQVQVNANGSFKVTRIIKSTNHGDDAAALDIARRSTYKAATRGGKPLTAFYDFTLRFSGGSVSSSGDDTSGSSSAGAGASSIGRMLHSGNYAGAKTAATAYLAANPQNAIVQAQLGVANTFTNDYSSAVAAFDKAGTIPKVYQSVAGHAYASQASTLSQTDPAASLKVAQRGVAVSQDLETLNALGTAQMAAKDYPAAVVSFERARSMAASVPKLDRKTKLTLDGNLITAYLKNSQLDKATEVRQGDAAIDPSGDLSAQFVAYYQQQSRDYDSAKKYNEAVAALENAAAASPKYAVTNYANASFEMTRLDKPDFDRMKVDADKALAIDPNDPLANFAEGVA